MATFSKPAQTSTILLAKLVAQKLIVASPKLAEQYITFVGHYRLKGYWFHFGDPTSKEFRTGTTFEMIRDRYEFDREIRACILEAVERLEVARSGDKRFIKAYYDEYDNPYLPSSWAMSECVSLGIWSKTYQMLRDASEKKSIAAKFGIGQVEVFESWLHTVTVLRNMAAHHDRFLGQKLGVGPANLKAKSIKFSDNKSVYAALTVVHVLLDSIEFNTPFYQRLVDLKVKYGMGLMQELGFPNNWPTGAIGW